MRTETSNRWLNVALLLALIVALYLNFSYQDEDLKDYYKIQSQQTTPTVSDGSISAR